MPYIFDVLPVASKSHPARMVHLSAKLCLLVVVSIFALCHPGNCLPRSFTRFRLDKASLVSQETTAQEKDSHAEAIEHHEIQAEPKTIAHGPAQEVA